MEIEGIQCEATTPYNPNQNSVSERFFWTLFERTQAMLNDEGLPNNQWEKAISTAVYFKNKSPTKSLKKIMLYEADTGRKSDLSNLHRFGCIAYHHGESPQKKKLSNRGIKCQFFKYESQNQHMLWDLLGRKVIRFSHVIWDELEISFPIKPSGEDESEDTDVTFMQWYDLEDELALFAYFQSPIEKFSRNNESVTQKENTPSHFSSLFSFPPESPQLSQENTSSEPEEPKESEQPRPFNGPQRSTVKPTDYAKLHNPWNPHLKKLEDGNSQQKMGFAFRAFKVNLESDTPQNYQQAVSFPEKIKWIEAMQEEFDSHQVHKTWEITELFKGRKVLPGR